MDIVLVRWPAEQERLDALRRQRAPRLLLVAPDAAPPITVDNLEDWIRLPAPDGDLRARVEALTEAARSMDVGTPRLDRDGVLRFAGSWVSLPPLEARLMAALLERFGSVVSREALARSGWPGGAPGRNALDVHVLRLRRRIEALGLVITTVRSRGYLVEGGGGHGLAAVP